MSRTHLNRRDFLRRGLLTAAGLPLATELVPGLFAAGTAPPSTAASPTAVAIVACKSYGPEVRPALDKCFDLLGGIGQLVKAKTVTIKLNLTGTDFSDYMGRNVGETYMTHYGTAAALTAALFDAGATRIRMVESTTSRSMLETSLGYAAWDVRALSALGKVEFENTRNLGSGKGYSHVTVPGGGHMFSSFDLNHSYTDTDVFVSLAKLKNHVTAGVTLSMKNLFGITPNSLYGSEAGTEDATGGRSPIHEGWRFGTVKLPGIKSGMKNEPTWRVPRTVADICAARPIHLAIIDGITSVSGGEGPWCENLKFTKPGILIAGFNPVSTDAVGTAAMGYNDPRAVRTIRPFDFCDNHLLLAEQLGVGTADLSKIDVRGLKLEQARCNYG